MYRGQALQAPPRTWERRSHKHPPHFDIQAAVDAQAKVKELFFGLEYNLNLMLLLARLRLIVIVTLPVNQQSWLVTCSLRNAGP